MTDDTVDQADHAADRLPILILFLVIALLMAADLAADISGDAWPGLHLALEAAVIASALGGLALLWRRIRAARAEARALGTDLAAARADAERWRAEVEADLRAIHEAITRQFERWELTESERAIAFALLRGRMLKQIAAERGTSERTVRQQALGIYRKSGLRGRSELSAFFLEGLLSPAA